MSRIGSVGQTTSFRSDLVPLGFDGGRLAKSLENTNRSISVFHIDGVGVGTSRRSRRKQYARIWR
jgi:hypothetical protein